MRSKKIYRISNSLFIYERDDGWGELVYITNPLRREYKPILNMKIIEYKIDEIIRKITDPLFRYATENLEPLYLFTFLLKIRLYEEAIANNIIIYIPDDEYNRLINGNILAFVIAEYLIDKEPIFEEYRSIIKDPAIFNKLYFLFRDPNFTTSKEYIKNLFNRFLSLMKFINFK